MEKKYVFIKSYTTQYGTIPENTDAFIFRGQVYINGGLCSPAYASIIRNLISDDDLHKEYLKDVSIQKNEF